MGVANEGVWKALPAWLQPRYLYPLYVFAWAALIEAFRLVDHWKPHGFLRAILLLVSVIAMFVVAMLPWLIRDIYIGNISAGLASSDPSRLDSEDAILFGLDLSSVWFAFFPQWLLKWLTAPSRRTANPAQIAEVEIVVLQQEAVTGRDQGAIFIENGNLKFRGLRTNFALRPDSIEYHAPRFRDIFGRYEVAHLRNCGLSVGLRQYTRRIGRARRPYTNLLAGWTSRAEASTERALLPPSAFLPEARVSVYLVVLYCVLFAWLLETGISNWNRTDQRPPNNKFTDTFTILLGLHGAIVGLWYAIRQWRLQGKLLKENPNMFSQQI
jgi:hypothetical protein